MQHCFGVFSLFLCTSRKENKLPTECVVHVVIYQIFTTYEQNKTAELKEHECRISFKSITEIIRKIYRKSSQINLNFLSCCLKKLNAINFKRLLKQKKLILNVL